MNETIAQILHKRDISIFFQPIQDMCSEEVFGFEALARGPGDLFSPVNLFRAAKKVGRSQEMELLCFNQALSGLDHFLKPIQIFINISPDTLIQHHEKMIHAIKKYRQHQNRIIIELAEIGLKEKRRMALAEILMDIKQTGIQVALDDVGSGDRSFSNICELPADYLKIDRSIIQGLTKYQNGSAPHYLTALEAMLSIAGNLGAKVIAEGVETPKQYEIVKSAGVHLAQGFYFSQPRPVEYWKFKEVTTC
ncbi:EAL domain-containing protein [Desulforamulus ruminis]|uniref:EAL domain protein n=1 Tax=Desulforamulus ruminis (strain ATCC 23193 / DSM 2154 / NCIMB 8452 / DL) TaxID=696281 RepID=F6DTU9_DESRL|nr:EAL domain-containing protein [Desulforamulus ruminis]AEG58967.1 EAL domain protein [Desulforamulus ruminis DSM 2154]